MYNNSLYQASAAHIMRAQIIIKKFVRDYLVGMQNKHGSDIRPEPSAIIELTIIHIFKVLSICSSLFNSDPHSS